mgnify:CR=1 FL=1
MKREQIKMLRDLVKDTEAMKAIIRQRIKKVRDVTGKDLSVIAYYLKQLSNRFDNLAQIWEEK